jgi:hypothetical protein
MNEEKEKITIGICSPGYVSTMFMTSILDLARSQKVLNQFITLEGSGVISRLRNQVAATFLEKTTDDWLLMIDTDEKLSIEGFKKLIAAADKDERPIVSGVVFGGWQTGQIYLEPVPCIFKLGESGGLFAFHDYPEDSTVEVDAAGTGCLMVHRRVLEAFVKNADPVHQGDKWCFFQDMPLHQEWVGEDLLFCLRAKGLGFPIHAVTGCILPHERRYWLSSEHHKDFQRFVSKRHMGLETSNGNE